MIITKMTQPVIVAQFSDCHLYADINQYHHGANVYKHLQQILTNIANDKQIDVIVFTGDLTQDHSRGSYLNFTELVTQANFTAPIFYLAGNHDDPALLTQYLVEPTFNSSQCINTEHWQIQLIDSKSETPAGYVSQDSLNKLYGRIEADKCQLLMMHHHPVDVGYFIDHHGLTNQTEFWQSINRLNQCGHQVKAIACGHVHNAMTLKKSNQTIPSVDVYTCPATSIAFDPNKDKVSSLGVAPSYRLFYLYEEGTIKSEIITL
jgi:Icc protein